MGGKKTKKAKEEAMEKKGSTGYIYLHYLKLVRTNIVSSLNQS